MEAPVVESLSLLFESLPLTFDSLSLTLESLSMVGAYRLSSLRSSSRLFAIVSDRIIQR